MTVPYSLLIIKPLTVGRGEASTVLQKILEQCPVALRMFRAWSICGTTLNALTVDVGLFPSTLNYEQEKFHAIQQRVSWICVFTHLDRINDPFPTLDAYCGPEDPSSWTQAHLRYHFGGFTQIGRTAHPSDTVIHLAHPERANYEANLLFLNFKEDQI